MNDKYTAQAPTQEEAIEKGLNALDITREEAIISVEEPGKKGFLGIGQRDAVVTIERKEKLNVVDEFLSNEFDMDRKKSEETAEEQETAVDTEELKEQALAEESTMDMEESIIGRDRAEVELVGEEAKAVQTQTVDETDEFDDDADDEEPEDTFDVHKTEDLTDEEIFEIDQKAIDGVRLYLKDIITAMGVDDAEVYTSRVENNVKYDIETENAGLVIGRHGKVLNGLQTLAQNHMHQLAYSKINVRVDAEKYRERRKNTVENLATRTADKVIKTNKAVKLDPMPAHERKQIHRYLNQNPKVKTHSEGREPNRYLVVEPNN